MNYLYETKMHVFGYLITDFRIPKHSLKTRKYAFQNSKCLFHHHPCFTEGCIKPLLGGVDGFRKGVIRYLLQG